MVLRRPRRQRITPRGCAPLPPQVPRASNLEAALREAGLLRTHSSRHERESVATGARHLSLPEHRHLAPTATPPPRPVTKVRQFARSPYAAGFTRAGAEFILATVHILWGNKPADRLPEITELAQWLRRWADRPDDWNQNLLVLGDLNVDRTGDPLYQAFVSTGLFPPTEMDSTPRTISITTTPGTSTTRSPGSPPRMAPRC